MNKLLDHERAFVHKKEQQWQNTVLDEGDRVQSQIST